MDPSHNAARHTFRYSDTVHISWKKHGHGPVPLIFLHGFAAALTTWHDLVPLFPPDHYRLYLIDLKGFGFSSKPRDGRYSLTEQAAIVTAFMEKQGITNAVLAGHSSGGTVALLTLLAAQAEHKENLIGSLVLIDCAAYPQRLPQLMRLLRKPLIGALLMHLVPARRIVEYTLPRVFCNQAAITTERIERYVSCFNRRGLPYVFVTSVRQIVPANWQQTVARYREIRVPTLIIWGREDRVIRVSQGEELASSIPRARLEVIEGCGHNPHEEYPAKTCAAIRRFLEEAER